jgi:hypothetical protein
VEPACQGTVQGRPGNTLRAAGAEEKQTAGNILTPGLSRYLLILCSVLIANTYDLRVYQGLHRQADHGEPAV